jgi:alanine racemase
MPLRAVAEVNLAAIERNVMRLRSLLSSATELCAVVKADAYGHGAVPVSRAALAAGATTLGVATATEAAELRAGGITAPILVLGALSAEELKVALAACADVVAWDLRFVESLRAAAARAAVSAGSPVGVHVKLDSGMGRFGTRDLEEALAVAAAVAGSGPGLRLAGAMTHFATSEADQEFVDLQLEAFMPFVEHIRALAGDDVVVHAANSGAILQTPASQFDMVRPGIALYGGDPMHRDPEDQGLEPALALHSYVAAIKPIAVGESVGYGRHFIASRDSYIATIPIGYADGIPRALANNCDLLIGGHRYPLVGMVSMDNITVDLGPPTSWPQVELGTRVTIIGADLPHEQTVEEVARRAGTINYEILCGISRRVPRVYHRDGVAA